MALIICPECGEQVSDKSKCCLKCGYPIKDIITKKQVDGTRKRISRNTVRVVLLFVVIFFVFACVLIVKNVSKRNGLYYGIEWGSSKNTVEKKYSAEVLGDTDQDAEVGSRLYCREEAYIEGVGAWVTFSFKNDKLYKVEIMTSETNSKIAEKEIPDKVKEYLVNLYGEYEQEDDSTYIWNTSKSDIKMRFYDSMATVTYSESDKGNAK